MQKILLIFQLALGLFSASISANAAPDLSAPSPIFAQGTYIHSGTKMRFPVNLAAFVRVGILRFDTTGNDIGAAYNLLNSKTPIAINVYVYPKPEVTTLNLPAEAIKESNAFLEQNKFNGIKDEIINADPGAKLITEGNILLHQGTNTHRGKVALYSYNDGIANAYLFDCGNWFIEYRINYPQTARKLAGVEVKKFMNLLLWPKC